MKLSIVPESVLAFIRSRINSGNTDPILKLKIAHYFNCLGMRPKILSYFQATSNILDTLKVIEACLNGLLKRQLSGFFA